MYWWNQRAVIVAQIDIGGWSRFLTLIFRIGLAECCFEYFFFQVHILHPLVGNHCVGGRHTTAYVICCFLCRHKTNSFMKCCCVCRWWHYDVTSTMLYAHHHHFQSRCALACLIDLSLCTLIYDSIVSLCSCMHLADLRRRLMQCQLVIVLSSEFNVYALLDERIN